MSKSLLYLLIAGLLTFGAAIGGASPASATPCELDLQMRGAITVDGNASDWTQGAMTSSATNGCVDAVTTTSGSTYDVTVYSRRYESGGTEYLGFLFEVPDATTQLASDPSQSTREAVYVYFDPDQDAGSTLEADDRRLRVGHNWETASSGSPRLDADLEWGTPTSSSATCPTKRFQPVTPAPSELEAVVVSRSSGPGYRVEIQIPTSAIGLPTGDIRMAFAVIDDQGTNMGPSSGTDKFAASFPAALPSTNADNPAASCPSSYHAPSNYGVGLWNSGPGDVTISRQPVFWNSEDLLALQCGETTTYRYYRDTPCQLTLEATLTNSRQVDLKRNVLYVWADHGASPSRWRFIDLQKDVTIPAGGQTANASDLWGDVPSGLAHHPCVRAYILPLNLNQGGWDETSVRNVRTNADLQNMMTAYGLNTSNWAQKNISANTPTEECPSDACPVEGAAPGGGTPFDVPEPSGWLLLVIVGAAAGGWLLVRRLAPSSFSARPRWGVAAGVLLIGLAVACQPTGTVKNGSDTPDDDGNQTKDPVPVLMSSDEFQQFHPDNAIVQMQVLGFVPVENPPSGSSDFYDVMGGVFRLLPLEQVESEGKNGIPVELQVSNTGAEARRLVLQVDAVLPPRLQEENLELSFTLSEETKEVVLEPEETRTLRGALVLRPIDR